MKLLRKLYISENNIWCISLLQPWSINSTNLYPFIYNFQIVNFWRAPSIKLIMAYPVFHGTEVPITLHFGNLANISHKARTIHLNNIVSVTIGLHNGMKHCSAVSKPIINLSSCMWIWRCHLRANLTNLLLSHCDY